MEAKLQQRIEYFQKSVTKVPLSHNEEIIQNEFKKQEILREEMQSFISGAPHNSGVKDICARAEVKICENEKILRHFGTISALGNFHSNIVEVTIAKVLELNADPLQNLKSNRKEVSNRLDSVWSWVERLSRLSQLHLQNAAEFHRFFQEVGGLREATDSFVGRMRAEITPEKMRRRQNTNDRVTIDADFIAEGVTILKEVVAATRLLDSQSESIVPLHKRITQSPTHHLGVMLADYQSIGGDFTFGEEVDIIDNSFSEMWQIKSRARDLQATVPSLVVWIPPSSSEALSEMSRLKSELLEKWSEAIDFFTREVIDCLKETLENIVENYEHVEVCSIQKLKHFVKLVETGILKDSCDHNALQLRAVIQKLRHVTTSGSDSHYHESNSLDRHTFFLSSLKLLHMDRLAKGMIDMFNCQQDLDLMMRHKPAGSSCVDPRNVAIENGGGHKHGDRFSGIFTTNSAQEDTDERLQIETRNRMDNLVQALSDLRVQNSSVLSVQSLTREKKYSCDYINENSIIDTSLATSSTAKDVRELYNRSVRQSGTDQVIDSSQDDGASDVMITEEHRASQTEDLDVLLKQLIEDKKEWRRYVFEVEKVNMKENASAQGSQTEDLENVVQRYIENNADWSQRIINIVQERTSLRTNITTPENIEHLVQEFISNRPERIKVLIRQNRMENQNENGTQTASIQEENSKILLDIQEDFIQETIRPEIFTGHFEEKVDGDVVDDASIQIVVDNEGQQITNEPSLKMNKSTSCEPEFQPEHEFRRLIEILMEEQSETELRKMFNMCLRNDFDSEDDQSDYSMKLDCVSQTSNNCLWESTSQTKDANLVERASQIMPQMKDICVYSETQSMSGVVNDAMKMWKKPLSVDYSSQTVKCSWDFSGQTIQLETWDDGEQTIINISDFAIQTDKLDTLDFSGQTLKNITDFTSQTTQIQLCDASGQTLKKVLDFSGQTLKTTGDFLAQTRIEVKEIAVETLVPLTDNFVQSEKLQMCDYTGQTKKSDCNFAIQVIGSVSDSANQSGHGIFETAESCIQASCAGLDIQVGTGKVDETVSLQTEVDLIFNWMRPDGGFWASLKESQTGKDVQERQNLLKHFKQKMFSEIGSTEVGSQQGVLSSDVSVDFVKLETVSYVQTDRDLVLEWLREDGGFFTDFNMTEGGVDGNSSLLFKQFRKMINQESNGVDIGVQTKKNYIEVSTAIDSSDKTDMSQTDKDLIMKWISPDGDFWLDWNSSEADGEQGEHIRIMETFRQKMFHEAAGPDITTQTEKNTLDAFTGMNKVESDLMLQTEDNLIVEWISPDGGFWKRWEENKDYRSTEHDAMLESFRKKIFKEKIGPEISVQTEITTTEIGLSTHIVGTSVSLDTDKELVVEWISFPEGNFWKSIESSEIPDNIDKLEGFRHKLLNEKIGPDISLQTDSDLLIQWISPDGGFWKSWEGYNSDDDIPEHMRTLEKLRKNIFHENSDPEVGIQTEKSGVDVTTYMNKFEAEFSAQTDSDLILNWIGPDGGFWNSWNFQKEDKDIPEHLKHLETFRQKLFNEQTGPEVSIQTDKDLVFKWITPEGGFWTDWDSDELDEETPEHLKMLESFRQRLFHEKTGPEFCMQTDIDLILDWMNPDGGFWNELDAAKDRLECSDRLKLLEGLRQKVFKEAGPEISMQTDKDLVLNWIGPEGGFWDNWDATDSENLPEHLKMMEKFRLNLFNEKIGPEISLQTEKPELCNGINSSVDMYNEQWTFNKAVALSTDKELLLQWMGAGGGFWEFIQSEGADGLDKQNMKLLEGFRKKVFNETTGPEIGAQTEKRQFSDGFSSSVDFYNSSRLSNFRDVSLTTDMDLFMEWMSTDGEFWLSLQDSRTGLLSSKYLPLLDCVRQKLFHYQSRGEIGLQTGSVVQFSEGFSSSVDFYNSSRLSNFRDVSLTTDMDLFMEWMSTDGEFWLSLQDSRTGLLSSKYLPLLDCVRQKLFHYQSRGEIGLQTGSVVQFSEGFSSSVDFYKSGGSRGSGNSREVSLTTDMELFMEWMSIDGKFWLALQDSRTGFISSKYLPLLDGVRQKLFLYQSRSEVGLQTESRSISEAMNTSVRHDFSKYTKQLISSTTQTISPV